VQRDHFIKLENKLADFFNTPYKVFKTIKTNDKDTIIRVR